MKRNTVTIIIGILLLLIFVLLLFTFQVRQTEVAVVTTFDRPTRFETNAGLKWKLPPPIQKKYIFDQRIHNFEGRFEQILTQDGYPVLVMVYVGWTVNNPTNFFSSFSSGKASEAEPSLAALVESGKNEVIGKHPFSHFVSTDEKQLKFVEVEEEMLQAIRPIAQSKYGIDVKFVGIKKLGLPPSVTEKVFARMQEERNREALRLRSEGEAEAMNIRSAADRDRDKILAGAAAQAMAIRGEAEAEAAKSFAVFEKNQFLAVLLLKLKTLEDSLKVKSTLVFDDRIPPFDLLTQQPKAPDKKPVYSGGQPKPGADATGSSVLASPK